MRSGYVRADYARPGLRWETVSSDTDLFGDGVLRLLETPGHAAGHMSLLIQLPDARPVLLTADASDNEAQWEGRQHVRALHSREQAARSLERLHALADETGAAIVFGHDPENWAGFRHAPEAYA
jgi:glyoxylase-like metal-dependent hydrolase (beta-lactamase superfamily II)